MIFTCVTDIHNNWITLINLTANSLIAKSHTLEISYTCFCGGDKAILANDLVKNAANKPRISALLTGITILAGNLLNRGINLWHRLCMCKIEVSHRSKRRQSAIIIFTIAILVKTMKVFELISYQAITLLYDLLLWLKMSVLPRYSSSQATRVTVTLHPQYKAENWNCTNKPTRCFAYATNAQAVTYIPPHMLGFAPCARRVERHGLRTRTSLHLAGYCHSPKCHVYPDFAALILHYYFMPISLVDGNTV